MLAIASRRFNAPSETFIRNHVWTICPGEIILVCQNGEDTEQFECPVLSGLRFRQPVRSITDLPASALRLLWRVYVDPGLGAAERRRLVEFLQAHGATALLAEYGMTGCLLGEACAQAGVPLYVHFHGFDASMMIRHRHQVRHYQAMFQRAAAIIAPSRFLAGKLIGIGCPEGKLHVSPYGIDPQRFAVTRRRSQRLLAVGRLVEKKAPHLTIAAFGRIAERFPEARLDIVGDGQLAARCEALVDELGLSDQVHLHGAQSSEFVAGLMQEASLFVQHSVTAADGDSEGLPVAILEAMTSAVPVVATRHSGIPESVIDGQTGLLVDEHDVEGMADAMAALLDDPKRAARMGVAGRKRVLKHFTLEQASQRLRAIMGIEPLPGSQPKSGTTVK